MSSQNIDDYPLTIHDVNNTHAIFGPDISGLRGKTVRQKTDIAMKNYVAVLRDFLALHKYVTLMTDVCFIKNVAFWLLCPEVSNL